MTLPVEINPLALSSQAKYLINRSLRFDGTAYLTRTPASATNRKTWTFSCWVKRTTVDTSNCIVSQGADITNSTKFEISNGNRLYYAHRDGGTITDELFSTQLFRDTSAWYHLVCAVDTTQATDTNRIKFYVNGSQVSSFFSSNYPTLNFDTDFNTTTEMTIGAIRDKTNDFLGYMTEINFIDGQQLDASSFGRTDPVTGVWIPRKYSGSYGTNGFYLDFSDPTSTTTLGYDRSGNGNHFTLTNFSVTAGVGYDSMTDTPTNNFATFVPISTNETISDGALVATTSINTETTFEISSIAVNSGKWYVEFTPTALSSVLTTNTNRYTFGIFRVNEYHSPGPRVSTNPNGGIGDYSTGYCYQGDGTKKNNGTSSAYGASYTTNDIIGVAYDAGAGTIIFYKNGVSQGTAYTGITSGFYYFATSTSTGSITATATYHINCGQRPFSYTPPSGYKALCTQNLPEPSIFKPNQYVNAVTYSGTGVTRTVTGVGFQPNLVWTKSRTAVESHKLVDSVRGATRALSSDSTLDEVVESGITSFDSDGFTINGTTDTGYNTNAQTYVSWNWKEGAIPGFDIVTYTGTGVARTISHSLGAVPQFIIIKARTTAGTDQGWPVYVPYTTSANYYLLLNSSSAEINNSTVFGTAPTSSVFSVGTNALVNTLNDTYVAYLFTEIPGFSRIGPYIGNGSTNGAYINCGFRPKIVITKSISNARNWAILDTARNTFNVADDYLTPQSSAIEATSNSIDFLSNGFKFRSTGDPTNRSGQDYFFVAFAENPFKYALAR